MLISHELADPGFREARHPRVHGVVVLDILELQLFIHAEKPLRDGRTEGVSRRVDIGDEKRLAMKATGATQLIAETDIDRPILLGLRVQIQQRPRRPKRAVHVPQSVTDALTGDTSQRAREHRDVVAAVGKIDGPDIGDIGDAEGNRRA